MDVEEIILLGGSLIQEYDWLLNASTLNYFKDNHWTKLPRSWQHILRDIDPPELATLMNKQKAESSSKRVWPLSLLALQVAVAHFSIPRHKVEQCNPSLKQWMNICVQPQDTQTVDESHKTAKRMKLCDIEKEKVSTEFQPMRCEHLLTTPCLSHPRLRQLFKKNVKPKKRHEIEKLSKVVASSARDVNCNYVIDVGSGVGHLSRMLAYGYGLKVCCIERQDKLSSQGTRLDVELEKTVAKHLSKEEMRCLTRPVRMNVTLDHESDQQRLIQTIKTAFDRPLDSRLVFGIVGLHTCGDLAVTLMRLFANCPDAVFVNIVGCCYMKLTTDGLDNANLGFPMSEFHSTRIGLSLSRLSYEALEVACHANEIYCQQLRDRQFCDQKVHCYRAVLEEIIMNNWPELQNSGITSVKCTSQMSFPEYCDKALSKMNVSVPFKDLTSEKTLRNLSEWQQVVTFISLRLMLAPLVETIVLLDRLVYFREKGFQSAVVPIFDPSLSPRNHVLIATRQ